MLYSNILVAHSLHTRNTFFCAQFLSTCVGGWQTQTIFRPLKSSNIISLVYWQVNLPRLNNEPTCPLLVSWGFDRPVNPFSPNYIKFMSQHGSKLASLGPSWWQYSVIESPPPCIAPVQRKFLKPNFIALKHLGSWWTIPLAPQVFTVDANLVNMTILETETSLTLAWSGEWTHLWSSLGLLVFTF